MGLVPINVELGNQVYKKFEPASEIYFLIKGRVAMLNSDNLATALFYFEGAYFGEIDVLYRRCRTETAYAETNLELWKISKSDFLCILEDFPDVKQEVKALADQRETARIINLKAPLPVFNKLKKIICKIEKDDYEYFYNLTKPRAASENLVDSPIKKSERRRETFLRASIQKITIAGIFSKKMKSARNFSLYSRNQIVEKAKENLKLFFEKNSEIKLTKNEFEDIFNMRDKLNNLLLHTNSS